MNTSTAPLQAGLSGAGGLTDREARRRLERFGPNEIEKPPGPGIPRMFLEQVGDILVLFLIGATLVSVLAGELLDASVILAIVAVNSVIGVVQQYQAQRALEALDELAAPTARVRRRGGWRVIPSRELVPGDIVAVEAGDRVPADMDAIESANLRVDESILTGESVPVEKDARAGNHHLFAGTTVAYGRATGVVTATGMRTRVGRLARTIARSPNEDPPLKKKLNAVGEALAAACLLLVGATLAAGLLRREPLLEMFLTSVSLGVAAVPEGLPAVVTVVLALGTRRMSARNAIVRNLASVETLGSVTVICSDKTGTLTMNEMSVTEMFCGGERFAVSGSGYAPEGQFQPLGRHSGDAPTPAHEPLRTMLLGGLLCSDALLQKEKRGWRVIGDPTEGALVVAAAKAGLRRAECESVYRRVFEIPFDSTRKMMTTIHRTPEMQNGAPRYVSFTKGSPDVVLGRCTSVMLQDSRVRIDPVIRRQLESTVRSMASRALRVLALATREWDGEGWRSGAVEDGLMLVGYFGMIDPPRPEAGPAVAKCRAAGITPVMITGDLVPTAMAVARSIGICAEGEKAVLGSDVGRLSDTALLKVARDARVYAEVSPEHKSRIVQALKQDGHIVAMTGDGVNDAPALKWADIGIAMGVKGTDVAREASDMVLTDDNFATIVTAIEEGRTIYANVRKCIRYLLSCNSGELITVVGAVLAGMGRPLVAAQILWVNLVTDAAPAIALGMEKPEQDTLNARPPDPGQGIFTLGMVVRLLAEGLWIGALSLGTYAFDLYSGGSIAHARSMCFGVLVFMQLFHANNCRSERRSVFESGPFSSIPMVLALAVSALAQLFVMAGPLAPVFGVEQLAAAEWLFVAVVSATIVPVSETIKTVVPVE
ncbi:MAG: cation-translocating P-type ATPase [Firmicutes bacterium]|nr:cation-translocating P-type ATPase [Bacillota bacterium]